MSIEINYTKNTKNEFSKNIVLFSDEKFRINPLKRYLSNLEFSYINELLKTIDLKKIYLYSSLLQKKR